MPPWILRLMDELKIAGINQKIQEEKKSNLEGRMFWEAQNAVVFLIWSSHFRFLGAKPISLEIFVYLNGERKRKMGIWIFI